MADSDNRRQFPRLAAPVYCRPAGVALLRPKTLAIDVSLGGIRMYSDDPVEPGTPLELELFFPDGTSAVWRAEVVWSDPLGVGAPAKYDLGLKFVEIDEYARARLASALKAD